MPTRFEHLRDIAERLRAAQLAGGRIYRTRVGAIADDRLPALAVYGPQESGEASVRGHPRFQVTHTFAIEARVAARQDWDFAATALVEQVKDVLFTDGGWTKRWNSTPRYQVRQVVDAKGAQPILGEVLLLTCVDAAFLDYLPGRRITLTGFDVKVDALDPFDAAGDGEADPIEAGPDGTIEAEFSVNAGNPGDGES